MSVTEQKGDSVTAPLPATRAGAPDRDDPATEVADLRVLAVELGERPEKVFHHLADALVPPIHRPLSLEPHQKRRVPLDLGVEYLDQGFDVSAVGRLDPALKGLYVLLRHRPRSIAPGGGRG